MPSWFRKKISEMRFRMHRFLGGPSKLTILQQKYATVGRNEQGTSDTKPLLHDSIESEDKIQPGSHNPPRRHSTISVKKRQAPPPPAIMQTVGATGLLNYPVLPPILTIHKKGPAPLPPIPTRADINNDDNVFGKAFKAATNEPANPTTQAKHSPIKVEKPTKSIKFVNHEPQTTSKLILKNQAPLAPRPSKKQAPLPPQQF